MADEVKHYQVGTKYRIKLERAASTKGVDGFTVEAFGDDISEVSADAKRLFAEASIILRAYHE